MSKKSIYRHEYRVLVELLRQLREEKGVSQGAVASAFHWPQSTLSHVERGSRRLDLIEFLDYCHAIEIDPRVVFEQLMKRIDTTPSGTKP